MGENENVETLRIEIVGDTTNATEGLTKLISLLERLENIAGQNKGLKSLSNTLDKLERVTSSLDKGAAEKVDALAGALERLSGVTISRTLSRRLEEIANAANSINGANFAGVAAVNTPVAAQEAASAAGADLSGNVEMATRRVADLNNELERNRRLVNESARAAETAASRGTEGAERVTQSTRRMTRQAKTAHSAFSRLMTMFTRRVLYRTMNAAISGVTTAFKEGTNAVYLYSKSIGGDLAAAMDRIATSSKYLKGSLGAMVSPLIVTVAPILDMFVDKLVNVLNIVNQIISRLSGKTTWTKAVKTMTSYAGATDKANKSLKVLKNTILGIDEINPLNDNSSGASGAASAFDAYNFEEVPIDVAYIDGLIDKLSILRDIVKVIGIGFAAWKIASGVGRFFSIFKGGHAGGGVSLAGTLAMVLGGLPAIITTIGGVMMIPGLQQAMETGIDTIIKVYKGLWEVALQIAATSVYIVVMGHVDVKTVALGLANMGIIIGGTDVVITAVGALMSIPSFSEFAETGVAEIIKVFKGVGEVGEEIAAVSLVVTGLGFVSPGVILEGMEGLALVVGGLETLLIALGGLRQIEGFTWIVGEGGEVLAQLGEILGNFAGSIVDGFLDVSTQSLPDIGTRLSDFMTNLRPFFDGAAEVTPGTLESVGYIASAVLTLAGAELIDAIARFLEATSNIDEFITALPSLGEGVAKFAEKTNGIDESKLKTASAAVAIIAAFVSVVPKEGGLWQKITGEQDYKKFFDYLPTMGTSLKSFSQNIEGFKSTAVENAKGGAETILALTEKVPKTEGFIPWLTGKIDLDKFSDGLPKFGTALKEYSENIEGMKTDVVLNTQSAVESILTLANGLPLSGGALQDFFGEQSFSTLGWELAQFSVYFKDFYKYTSGLDTTKIQKFSKVLADLVTLAITIKDQALDNAINNFAEGLTNSTSDFKSFFESGLDMYNGWSLGYNFGTYIISGVKDALDSANLATYEAKKITSFGRTTYQLVPQYASGGFVNEGSMFIAGEAGPELVGRIGNRTAVANSDQIVDAVSIGVSEANNEQNALLREQNALLRELIAKEGSGGFTVSTDSLIDALDRQNRRAGKTIIPVGV